MQIHLWGVLRASVLACASTTFAKSTMYATHVVPFLIVICLIQNGKVAVHDLSFNMYENQITALLGQVCRAASVMITC